MGDLEQMQMLHKQLLPSLYTTSGWVFAGNLSAPQSGSIIHTATENPCYSYVCLLKQLWEAKGMTETQLLPAAFVTG